MIQFTRNRLRVRAGTDEHKLKTLQLPVRELQGQIAFSVTNEYCQLRPASAG